VTTPLEELAQLEERRTELERDRSQMQARSKDIERERSDLEARAARSTDVDELRKLREMLTEIDLEASVIENRTPGITQQLAGLGSRITEAGRAANRYRVSGLIVDADAVFERMLTVIDELGDLRQRVVADGAPAPLLAPPPGGDMPTNPSNVIAFTLADRLAVYLRGEWAKTIVPEARRDAGR
jgi:hypothetical protein